MLWVNISNEQSDEVLHFARDMTRYGYQRKKRTGGKHYRDDRSTFKDIVKGKYAEFAFYNYVVCQKNGTISKPNLNEFGRGKWDNGIDFIRKFNNQEYVIEVKSSTEKSRLILITAKDIQWDPISKSINFEHTEGSPDFLIGAKFDVTHRKVGLGGWLSRQDLIEAVQNPSIFLWKQGELIPGTSDKLDADNYIWVYPEFRKKVNERSGRKVPVAHILTPRYPWSVRA